MKPPPGTTEEEWCGGSCSFPPFVYVREEERCDDGRSFPPRGAREDERCGSRDQQTSRSGLGSFTPIEVHTVGLT
jgi:hypothetical protein